MMRDVKGKRVLIVGLGKSGAAAARFLSARGASLAVVDSKSPDELRDAAGSLKGLDIELSLGGSDAKLFDSAQMIVASPGVPGDLPGILSAAARGVPVIGELELALSELERPVVAITGTNGKTTTTTLVGHLLRESGMRTCVAGNIGTPLLDLLDEAMSADVVVLEVSSFQIETTPSLSPRIGILLNATPDHLDRHGSFDAYVECKAAMISNVKADGFSIFNAADDRVASAVAAVKSRLVPFDATGRVLARNEGRIGAWYEDGDLLVRVRQGDAVRFPLSRVKLEGMHNRENMLAALAAAMLCGAEPSKLRRALDAFSGLPHRMELVGECMGVRFYDDSKGTNVGATVRAIEAFAEPVVLIAGGLSKGADFASLAVYAEGRVKRAVLIGEAAADLERAFAGKVESLRAKTMEEAVGLAAGAAEPGDVVLLSPACASFDMFRDYAHRGEAFTGAVRRLSEKSDSVAAL
ncbi:MAG TPA: UDP-N-acetylmuramoyl-L-alanine--D-glutamate ligase [bacterium]|nr:UDP-N-acetylmuramoyl-L-alanine--D-glutamate ligase [bacterium]